MNTQAAIEEYIRAGHGDRTIARQIGVSIGTVTRARAALDLPAGRPGPKAAATPEDLFWRRATPTDDGHLIWPSYTRHHGAHINHGGRRHSVHRIAFRLANHREPVGRAQTGCGVEGCVHPQHVDDQTMRDQYAAIFGEVAA